MLGAQDRTFHSAKLDAPVSGALSAHRHPAVSAVPAPLVRAHVKRDDLVKAFISVPAMLDRGVRRRRHARIEEQGSWLQHSAGWHAAPLTCVRVERQTEPGIDESRFGGGSALEDSR